MDLKINGSGIRLIHTHALVSFSRAPRYSTPNLSLKETTSPSGNAVSTFTHNFSIYTFTLLTCAFVIAQTHNKILLYHSNFYNYTSFPVRIVYFCGTIFYTYRYVQTLLIVPFDPATVNCIIGTRFRNFCTHRYLNSLAVMN